MVDERSAQDPPVGVRLLRRTLPLALLGVAVALCLVKVMDMWPNRLTVQLRLDEQLRRQLQRVDMTVSRAEEPDHVLVSVWLAADDEDVERPLQHVFKLSKGRYRFAFIVYLDDGSSKQWYRSREISSAEEWTVNLPGEEP